MGARINVIDFLRGFCLLNIFVNHVSVGVLQTLSPSRYLLIDSADTFVFLAGISVALAYGSGRLSPGEALARTWRRAGHLYKVNLLVVAASLLILCAGAALAPVPMLSDHPLQLLPEHGLPGYLWHLVTLQQNAGYSMVLRLYVLLMLAAPLYLWLASLRFWYPLLVAVPLWLAGGAFGLVESNTLSGTPLRLTFLPWNLVFAGGIALGAAIIGKAEMPRSRMLDVLAIGVAVVLPFGLVGASRLDPAVLEWLNGRDEHFLLGASKTLQSPLRVLSLACAAYAIMRFAKAPVVRLLHEVSASNLFCRLGRNSLRVFAAGAVLALAIEQVLMVAHLRSGVALGSIPAVALEALLVMCGFLAMVWLAGSRLSASQQARTTASHISVAGGETG